MRFLPLIAAGLIPVAAIAEADMQLTFTWGDIPLCTSGRPNIVPSPDFVLTGVPDGTESVEFRLTDLNVPGYNHGGGTVDLSQSGTVPGGAFSYKSPCPPNGVHSYEWKATARGGGKVLAEATARRDYPE